MPGCTMSHKATKMVPKWYQNGTEIQNSRKYHAFVLSSSDLLVSSCHSADAASPL